MLTKTDIDWLIDSMKLVFPTREETIKKLDEVSAKLDAFIGEIKVKRESQELHDADHRRIEDRLANIENHASIPPLTD